MSTSLACPACQGSLVVQGREFACGRCHGLWLSSSALAARGAAPGADLVAVASRAPRTCPACQEPLTPYRSPLLEIDVCDRCTGVFLDRGELEILLRARRPAPQRQFVCEDCLRVRPLEEQVIGAEETLCAPCAERASLRPDLAARRRRERNRSWDEDVAQTHARDRGWGTGEAALEVAGFLLDLFL
jgi:Zn-finger nucleic acid-binding protein